MLGLHAGAIQGRGVIYQQINRIAAALVILGGTLAAGMAAAQQPVDLELVLAADGSGSIDDAELALQREGYADAVRNPRVLELLTGGIHGRSVIAYVEWGSAESQHTIVD